MTVVVTGAAGHVGGNLVRALLAEGRKVRTLVRNDTRALEGLDVERVSGNVWDPESLRAAFDGAEVVYHLAAVISIVGDPDGAVQRTNVEGVKNVLAACKDAGVKRLVHFSSIHAYQHHPYDQTLDETRATIVDPRAPAYDRTKAAGEAAVREAVRSGLDAVICVPAAVIGRHDYKPSRMGQVFLQLYRRKLPSLVPGGFDWVDVRDVVAGALAAEKRGRTGEKYNLFGHYETVRALSELAGEVSGVPAPRTTTPLWLAKVGAPFAEVWAKMTKSMPLYTRESLKALVSNSHTSWEKAARELGYSARPLRETVEDVYAWFREAGVIPAQPPSA